MMSYAARFLRWASASASWSFGRSADAMIHGLSASTLRPAFRSGDLVALGHDVVRRQVLALGQRQRLLELRQIGRCDDPRFVGEHVEARLQGGEDAIDLAAISAGEHYDVARLAA